MHPSQGFLLSARNISQRIGCCAAGNQYYTLPVKSSGNSLVCVSIRFMKEQNSRRDFVKAAGAAAVGASLLSFDEGFAQAPRKRRYAIVGTGDRGSSMWGRDLVRRYPDLIEFVALCDSNPKRAVAARNFIGVDCPTFTNFAKMIDQARPELLMVTTVDGFHHEYIINGLDRGLDVMTEKPMTTDETKCQAILDAERRNNKQIVVTFNYRYAPAHQTMKEILLNGEIGKIVSVDFSWYIDVI